MISFRHDHYLFVQYNYWEGDVAQWQRVRFACERPRVQSPASPYLFLQGGNTVDKIDKNGIFKTFSLSTNLVPLFMETCRESDYYYTINFVTGYENNLQLKIGGFLVFHLKKLGAILEQTCLLAKYRFGNQLQFYVLFDPHCKHGVSNFKKIANLTMNLDLQKNKRKMSPQPDQHFQCCRDQDSNLGYFGHNEGY